MNALLALMLFLSVPAAADSNVGLAWDQSPSPNLAGNRVYVGTASRTYGPPITIGLQTAYTVTGLKGPATYFFAVTAFDSAGNESDFSNEVSKFIDTDLVPVTLSISIVPAPGPTITHLSAAAISATQATITWVTSQDCSGRVYYGTDPARLSLSVAANNLGTTDHLALIGPLAGRTHYHYRVQSVCGSATIESDVRSFNTK